MIYGYVRSDSRKADKESQLKRLEEKGAEQIFTDPRGSVEAYETLLSKMQPGDTLLIESVDKIADNMTELQDAAEDLSFMGVTLITLRESIDTSTPEGKLKVLLSDHFTHI